MKNKIKGLASCCSRKFGTNNPFKIAECMNIEVQIGKLGFEGCYMFLKNHRCIFLNEDLPEAEMQFVMAHELGHAIMHRKQNCYFIRSSTFLLNSKTELEANRFAAELLIPDAQLLEYRECTLEQLSRIFGYAEKFISLKFSE